MNRTSFIIIFGIISLIAIGVGILFYVYYQQEPAEPEPMLPEPVTEEEAEIEMQNEFEDNLGPAFIELDLVELP